MTYNVFGGTLNLAQLNSNIFGYTWPILQPFHNMQVMDLYLIFQFIKGRWHGKQIMLP